MTNILTALIIMMTNIMIEIIISSKSAKERTASLMVEATNIKNNSQNHQMRRTSRMETIMMRVKLLSKIRS